MTALQSAAAKAVALWGALPFFPGDDTTKAAIMQELVTMCESAESVTWLGRKVANSYARWPGIMAVRGVYCTRFRPRDGQEVALGADDPVGREIAEKAEQSEKQSWEAPKLPPGALLMLEGACDMPDESAARLAVQKARWRTVLRRLPNLSNLREGREFENSSDPEEREAILARCERAAGVKR